MGKRLLIFGPPGAGKGTHAKRLSADLDVAHMATGELFREAIRNGTEFGKRADGYIRRGELVPDELVVLVLMDRLEQPDARRGYLLDGFPRTPMQARALDAMLTKKAERIDGVLCLDAPEDMLIKRIAGRSTCNRCHAVFNVFYHPPQDSGLCDQCGGPLSQRADDQELAVRRRLTEYRVKTSPVLEFFGEHRWPVWTVLSVGDVNEVYGRIRSAVGD